MENPTHSQTSKATADFVAFLNEVENPRADKFNPAFKSKYASLPAILKSIKKTARKYFLAIYQEAEMERDAAGTDYLVIKTGFMHVTGQMFPARSKMSVKVTGLNMQQFISASQYLRRQGACIAAGISVDVDDDGNAASGQALTQQRPATTPAPGQQTSVMVAPQRKQP